MESVPNLRSNNPRSRIPISPNNLFRRARRPSRCKSPGIPTRRKIHRNLRILRNLRASRRFQDNPPCRRFRGRYLRGQAPIRAKRRPREPIQFKRPLRRLSLHLPGNPLINHLINHLINQRGNNFQDRFQDKPELPGASRRPARRISSRTFSPRPASLPHLPGGSPRATPEASLAWPALRKARAFT